MKIAYYRDKETGEIKNFHIVKEKVLQKFLIWLKHLMERFKCNMFDENTIVEKIQLAELDKDKKYIIFMKYVNRPSNDIIVSNVRQLQNLLKDLDINNIIIVPEVKNEIEYSIVKSE